MAVLGGLAVILKFGLERVVKAPLARNNNWIVYLVAVVGIIGMVVFYLEGSANYSPPSVPAMWMDLPL